MMKISHAVAVSALVVHIAVTSPPATRSQIADRPSSEHPLRLKRWTRATRKMRQAFEYMVDVVGRLLFIAAKMPTTRARSIQVVNAQPAFREIATHLKMMVPAKTPQEVKDERDKQTRCSLVSEDGKRPAIRRCGNAGGKFAKCMICVAKWKWNAPLSKWENFISRADAEARAKLPESPSPSQLPYTVEDPQAPPTKAERASAKAEPASGKAKAGPYPADGLAAKALKNEWAVGALGALRPPPSLTVQALQIIKMGAFIALDKQDFAYFLFCNSQRAAANNETRLTVPGGKREQGEGGLQTALRELLEEQGGLPLDVAAHFPEQLMAVPRKPGLETVTYCARPDRRPGGLRDVLYAQLELMGLRLDRKAKRMHPIALTASLWNARVGMPYGCELHRGILDVAQALAPQTGVFARGVCKEDRSSAAPEGVHLCNRCRTPTCWSCVTWAGGVRVLTCKNCASLLGAGPEDASLDRSRWEEPEADSEDGEDPLALGNKVAFVGIEQVGAAVQLTLHARGVAVGIFNQGGLLDVSFEVGARRLARGQLAPATLQGIPKEEFEARARLGQVYTGAAGSTQQEQQQLGQEGELPQVHASSDSEGPPELQDAPPAESSQVGMA